MTKVFGILTMLLIFICFTPSSYSQVQKPKGGQPASSSKGKVKFIELQKLKAKKKKLESEIKKLEAQIKLYRQILNKIIKNLESLNTTVIELREALIDEMGEKAVLEANNWKPKGA